MVDRRGAGRCLVCQGPTRIEPGGLERCRNSLCAANHRDAVCPRCQESEVDAVANAGAKLSYCCRSCGHHWQITNAS